MIDAISPYSNFGEAKAQDREWVQAQIDAASNTADLTKSSPPPLTQWSSLHGLIGRLVSEVEAVKMVTISANSKKGSAKPKHEPVPHPVGVMRELLQRKRVVNHSKLRAMLLPGKFAPPADEET